MALRLDVPSRFGRSPHGERGLKYQVHVVTIRQDRRSPHGERGLKYACAEEAGELLRRSPHGERGLKYHATRHATMRMSRSPHGERGLKWIVNADRNIIIMSLSSRRAWIEIPAC